MDDHLTDARLRKAFRTMAPAMDVGSFYQDLATKLTPDADKLRPFTARSEEQTGVYKQVPAPKRRSTLGIVLYASLAVVIVAAIAVGGLEAVKYLGHGQPILVISDGGPVAADEAQIEMTYTGDGTSYVGDREIIQGTATVTISNESTDPVTVGAWRYETGSDDLAEALAVVQEGKRAVASGAQPPGAFDLGLLQVFPPGSYTRTMDLEPGTYIFDLGPGDYRTTGLWRLAVIEVVAE